MSWANQYRRNEQSRQAILDAAIEQCREVGYDSVSIEGIARRAGAGKQTIYRWWPTKGLLLLEALQSAGLDTLTFPDTGDAVADLVSQMKRAVRLMTAPATGPTLFGLINDARSDDALASRLRDDLINPRVTACLDRLRKARERGEITADGDERMLMEQLYGPLYYRLLISREPITPSYLHRLTIQVLRPPRK